MNGETPRGDAAPAKRDQSLSCLSEIEGDLAYWDDLTRLYNQRLLSRLLGEWWPQLIADQSTVSLIVIDLDGFKDVNDVYGHLTGDEVLRISARLIKNNFRENDIVIRYGGDEFVVLLPGVDTDQARNLAERARSAIEEHEFVVEGKSATIESVVSFSSGITCYPADGTEGLKLLELGDTRLYEDKRRRRPGRSWIKIWLMLIALAVAIGAIVGIGVFDLLEIRDAPPTVNPVITEIPAEAVAREAELIVRIEELQQQIERLSQESESAAEAPTAADLQELTRLRGRVSELQEELSKVSETQAEVNQPTPSPTPLPPSPTPHPIVVVKPQPSPTPRVDAVVEETIIVPPSLIGFDRPRYPNMARRMRRETSIRLEVLVDTDGSVTEVRELGEPAGLGFDEEARKAALSARYKPGTRNGEPVPMTAILLIQFSMDANP